MTFDPAMPEASRTYVGFWKRCWAGLVDSVLFTALLAPIAAIVFDINIFDAAEQQSGPERFLLSFVLPAIVVLVFWIRRQATPGKLLVHAQIVDARSGGEPRPAQLVVRYLGYYLSLFAIGLGFLWIAFDRRKQGWHDKLAGTVVVRAHDVQEPG